MKSPVSLPRLLVALWSVLGPASAWGAITPTGDVNPGDPTWWTNSTYGLIGQYTQGSVLVDAGSELRSLWGMLGREREAVGEVTVTGAGSQWNNGAIIYVGDSGNGTLNILAGGSVASKNSSIGNIYTAAGEATVIGANSQWTNSENLKVGADGDGVLRIGAGGTVTNRTGYVGYYNTSSGEATVTGTGTKWVNSSDFYVGNRGRGTLNIEAGGTVISSRGYIGFTSTGKVTVAGTDSKWVNSSDLYVGYEGSGSLRIQDGGVVTNRFGYLGFDRLSTSEVTVAGAGSRWINNSALYVGRDGAATLSILAGGAVTSDTGYLGYLSRSSGEVLVSGNGSQWIIKGLLVVGHEGNGALRVEDGGQVAADTLYASLTDLHGDGTITVASGAILDGNLQFDSLHPTQNVISFGSGGSLIVNLNRGVLGAGYKGAGRLTIADGITVNSSRGYLAYAGGSTGEATVTGAGSQWINNGNLYVGYQQGSGTLNIKAGGLVSNTNGYLGSSSGATGAATVTGPGSRWANSGELYVGQNGSGTLCVEDGGGVTAAVLYASLTDLYGDGTIAATNGAILDGDLQFNGTSGTQSVLTFGSGGVLTVTAGGGILGVGYKGAGSLTISNGVAVNSSRGYLGNLKGSSGEAMVTGAGSQWINSGDLYVGRYGSGALNIQTGGKVSNANGHLGDSSNTASAATVIGVGSQWNNYGTLLVGGQGIGILTISHGGLVSVAGALPYALRIATYDDSSVNLSTGGMLALASDETGDDSLGNFLTLVGGTKAIRYWDDTLAVWADITTATYGDDYTLEYLTSGDLAGYTLLTVGQLPTLAGDYNADGVVDAADYTVWRDNLGQTVTLPNQATPGSVTDADRDVWAANYGATLTADAIPEPNALALAAFALGLCTARRVAD